MEGVAVGESILKSTYNKASVRESIRRLPSSASQVFQMPPQSQLSMVERDTREDMNSSYTDGGRRGSRGSLNSSVGANRGYAFESIEEESGEQEHSDFEINNNQEQRRSVQTPRTDTGTEEDALDSFADDSDLDINDEQAPRRPKRLSGTAGKASNENLKEEIEAVRLKNYGLLLEIEELRDNEEELKTRVEELEPLLARGGKDEEDP